MKPLFENANEEHRLFLCWLSNYMPKMDRIIEIGVFTGATMMLWREFLSDTGYAIGVDNDLLNGLIQAKALFKGEDNIVFIEGDSKSLDTRKRVEDRLGSDKVDFLYIDGDHAYKACISDYRMYEPLVKSGGVIAFHDATRNMGVRKAIDEIINVYTMSGFRCFAQFDARAGHCGITALVKI